MLNTSIKKYNGLISCPLLFTIKSEDYCKRLHEFWKACKVVGLSPYHFAVVWREDNVVATISITNNHCYPNLHNRVEAGDIVELYVDQEGQLI